MPSSVESLPESSTLSARSRNAEETTIVCKSKSLECNVTSRFETSLTETCQIAQAGGHFANDVVRQIKGL
jgi:hypothetical protein